MRGGILLILLGTLSQGALAQMVDLQPQGGPPADQGTVLRGEDRVRYICQQLDLSPDQQASADGLLAVYRARIEESKLDMRERMERIRNLYIDLRKSTDEANAAKTEMDAAKADAEKAKAGGDAATEESARKREEAARTRYESSKARAEEMRKALQNEAPNAAAEKEFFETFEPMLKPEQREKLKEVIARLEKDPDVSLKPATVMNAARNLELTSEQKEKLDVVMRDMRARISGERDTSPEARARVVEELIVAIKGVLTPPQIEQFNKTIARLRPPAPAPVEPAVNGAETPAPGTP